MAGQGMSRALLNDVSRCAGGDCVWKKLCARWVQRHTGSSIHKRMCPGTGPLDEQPNFLEER